MRANPSACCRPTGVCCDPPLTVNLNAVATARGDCGCIEVVGFTLNFIGGGDWQGVFNLCGNDYSIDTFYCSDGLWALTGTGQPVCSFSHSGVPNELDCDAVLLNYFGLECYGMFGICTFDLTVTN